jgi:hypothetical protein
MFGEDKLRTNLIPIYSLFRFTSPFEVTDILLSYIKISYNNQKASHLKTRGFLYININQTLRDRDDKILRQEYMRLNILKP